MHLSIICTGCERLYDKIDTNSVYLSTKLYDSLGIETRMKFVVGDIEEDIEKMVKFALEISELVIISGGLGSSPNDITKEAAAKALEKELVYSQEASGQAENFYKNRQKKMPEIVYKKQSYIPRGFSFIPNSIGVAGGLRGEINGKIIILLPGPARELEKMVEDEVIPYLKPKTPKIVQLKRVLKTASLGEDLIVEKLEKFKNKEVKIETLAYLREVDIIITAKAENARAAKEKLDNAAQEIKTIFADAIFGQDKETIGEATVNLLFKKTFALYIKKTQEGEKIFQQLRSSTDNPIKVKRIFLAAETEDLKSQKFFIKLAVEKIRENRLNKTLMQVYFSCQIDCFINEEKKLRETKKLLRASGSKAEIDQKIAIDSIEILRQLLLVI